MNRRERRAAEADARKAQAKTAQTDKGFEDYTAQARRIHPKINDRELDDDER
jgi:hypothetical protein